MTFRPTEEATMPITGFRPDSPLSPISKELDASSRITAAENGIVTGLGLAQPQTERETAMIEARKHGLSDSAISAIFSPEMEGSDIQAQVQEKVLANQPLGEELGRDIERFLFTRESQERQEEIGEFVEGVGERVEMSGELVLDMVKSGAENVVAGTELVGKAKEGETTSDRFLTLLEGYSQIALGASEVVTSPLGAPVGFFTPEIEKAVEKATDVGLNVITSDDPNLTQEENDAITQENIEFIEDAVNYAGSVIDENPIIFNSIGAIFNTLAAGAVSPKNFKNQASKAMATRLKGVKIPTPKFVSEIPEKIRGISRRAVVSAKEAKDELIRGSKAKANELVSQINPISKTKPELFKRYNNAVIKFLDESNISDIGNMKTVSDFKDKLDIFKDKKNKLFVRLKNRFNDVDTTYSVDDIIKRKSGYDRSKKKTERIEIDKLAKSELDELIRLDKGYGDRLFSEMNSIIKKIKFDELFDKNTVKNIKKNINKVIERNSKLDKPKLDLTDEIDDAVKKGFSKEFKIDTNLIEKGLQPEVQKTIQNQIDTIVKEVKDAGEKVKPLVKGETLIKRIELAQKENERFRRIKTPTSKDTAKNVANKESIIAMRSKLNKTAEKIENGLSNKYNELSETVGDLLLASDELEKQKIGVLKATKPEGAIEKGQQLASDVTLKQLKDPTGTIAKDIRQEAVDIKTEDILGRRLELAKDKLEDMKSIIEGRPIAREQIAESLDSIVNILFPKK